MRTAQQIILESPDSEIAACKSEVRDLSGGNRTSAVGSRIASLQGKMKRERAKKRAGVTEAARIEGKKQSGAEIESDLKKVPGWSKLTALEKATARKLVGSRKVGAPSAVKRLLDARK